MEHFFAPNAGEDQKKKSSPKMERFFFSNSGKDLRSNAHQSQIVGGGMLMKTILKLLGGIQSNYWGDIFPHPPRISAPLVRTWTYKNADEKAHTFSRSKNVKNGYCVYSPLLTLLYGCVVEECKPAELSAVLR